MGTSPPPQVQAQVQAPPQVEEILQKIREVVGRYKGREGYLEEILESLERDIAETLANMGISLEDTIIGRNCPEKRLGYIYTGLWYWVDGIRHGIAISLKFAKVRITDKENLYRAVSRLEDYRVELGKYYDWRDWK